ncbi:MAG: RNA-binding protein [Elusimicrobia bacterium]|nr:RNA-binding protein [Elusimicrobiota bacterium]
MPVNLFVGGIPYEMTQAALTELFSACGAVTGVKLIMDRDTGRSKGFGFVEMGTEPEAQAAIAKFNGTELEGRKIFVSVARPQVKRPVEPVAPGGPGTPGFIERRSGLKDRRRPQPGADEGRRPAGKPWQDFGKREGSAGPRKWGPKPGGFGGPKKWGDKPAPKKWGAKPSGFSGPKKWGDKPAAGGEKRRDFSGPKKWGPKPGGFSGPKKWGKKPGGFGRKGGPRPA